MKVSIQWITRKVGILPGTVNTGILREGTSVMVIDPGLDRDWAMTIFRALEREGLEAVGIVNTHAHADHCGGNAHLQKKCGLPILAPRLERYQIETPYFETLTLFGGAHPPAALQHKFLQAKPSVVDHTFEADQKSLRFGDFDMELVPLPGHSVQQTGIQYDGALFSADAFLDPVYLEKYLIPYNADVMKQRESLCALRQIESEWVVPAHGEPLKNPASSLWKNEEALDFVDDWLLTHTRNPATIDELLAGFCRTQQVPMETISQYHLYRTAFSAHLSALSHQKRIRHVVAMGSLKWQHFGR